MKGSAKARTVIAAPVNAEDRLLKVCVSVADKNNLIKRLARHWTGLKLIVSLTQIVKALYAAVCELTFITPTNIHLSSLSDFNY